MVAMVKNSWGSAGLKIMIEEKKSGIFLNPNQYGGGHYGPPMVFPQYLQNDLS